MLPSLLRLPNPGSCLLFIDLATVPDAARVIGFVKTSTNIKRMPIITLGTADDYDVIFWQRYLPEGRAAFVPIILQSRR